jgi:CHAD domain-containing protein
MLCVDPRSKPDMPLSRRLPSITWAPILRKMRLESGQVRKPIREMRKSLRDLPNNPPQKTVHNLRTRSRRLEAIGTVLPISDHDRTRRLLKSLKPLRKAAGDVRDMDVLEAKVQSLLRRCRNQSFARLLLHLQKVREESAQQLVKDFSSDKKTVRRELKRFSKLVEKQLNEIPLDYGEIRNIFDELSHWPRLSADNLHEFRIKIKELRYMMQLMSNANSALMRALENVKMRIGVWHDWEELYRIAEETLDACKDRRAIDLLAQIKNEKLRSAMRAAQALRTRYLRTHSLLEVAEP